jgi:hypothetical protein
MGYRSDVAYLIRGPKDTMMGLLAQIKVAEPHLQEALKDCVVTEQPSKHWVYEDGKSHEVTVPTVTVAFHMQGVKWYDSYPYVQNHEALRRYFADAHEEHNDSYEIDTRFVRIGEETGDIDETDTGDDHWDLHERLNVSVSLVIDEGSSFDEAMEIREGVEPDDA